MDGGHELYYLLYEVAKRGHNRMFVELIEKYRFSEKILEASRQERSVAYEARRTADEGSILVYDCVSELLAVGDAYHGIGSLREFVENEATAAGAAFLSTLHQSVGWTEFLRRLPPRVEVCAGALDNYYREQYGLNLVVPRSQTRSPAEQQALANEINWQLGEIGQAGTEKRRVQALVLLEGITHIRCFLEVSRNVAEIT